MGYKFNENADLFPEGIYLFEIVTCEDKLSKKGQGMFVVDVRDVDTNRRHRERWMTEGGGAGMTVRKLKGIGLDLSKEVEAVDLIGRRFFGKIVHKDGGSFGWQAQISATYPESKPPAGYQEPPERPEDGFAMDDPANLKADDTPF